MRKIVIIGVLAIGLLAAGAQGLILPDVGYEFDKHPDDVSYGAWAMIKAGAGYANPSDIPPHGLQMPVEDTAIFSDLGNEGNNAFWTPVISGSYTVDMRIHGQANSGPDGRAKMGSISHSPSNKGRGVRWEPLEQGGNAVRITFISSGPIAPSPFDVNKTTDDYGYHMIRMVVEPDGDNAKVTVYDLERQTVPGQWDLVGIQPLDGATGSYGVPGCFGLGSSSGGITTMGQIQADWVRVKTVAMSGFDEILAPEPATLALLALGLVPTLRRRR